MLVASYVFYGWWEPKFLLLIIASSTIDYCIGVTLGRTQDLSRRRLLLGVSVAANLGMLGVFKYYNFFVDSLREALGSIGVGIQLDSLDLILPVGISFYTFQTLSYTIDVYRGKLEPTSDGIAFFTFVAFFPQLVAGPIERATHLLNQFDSSRSFSFESGREGMRRILYGLFKKVVIADQCGVAVNHIFANHESMSGSTLVVGAVLFAFQIYGDFSGYSDIAIGSAKLFGIDLMDNFKLPYFSRDPAEFWRRWHVSLSSWFRDYVYIPLGGSRHGTATTIRNTCIVFVVSGLWHGANWTFVIWGLLHWLFFLPLLLSERNRQHVESVVAEQSVFPRFVELVQMMVTFGLVTFAWVFFRAESTLEAMEYLGGIFDVSLFSWPTVRSPLWWIGLLLSWEWLQRCRRHPGDVSHLPMVVRWLLYLLVAVLILAHHQENSEFIYFQF